MGAPLRIVSANLWSGKADPDGFAELVTRLGADAVCCQELTAAQAEALGKVLPYGELAPEKAFHGMGIALARPAEIRRIPLPYRGAWSAQLHPDEWPDLDCGVEVINVHIAAPHANWGLGAAWYRRQQLRALEPYLQTAGSPSWEGASARALVGDCNATPVWPVYRRLTRHLRDAAVIDAQRSGRQTRATWGPWHGAPRMLRLDHGFVHGLRVEAFQVVNVPGSDHSAVVMDVAPDL